MMKKKVAIVGFGSEGLAAYRFFASQGADITIFDESEAPNSAVPDGAKLVTGPGCFDDLNGYDVVVRFPGIAPSRIHTDGEITSVTKEFFRHCPVPIIGVTGTKGKGTTSSLIQLMLQNAGYKVHLLGNIGVPALDELPKIQPTDLVVFELSSFQLWDLEQSPHIAVVLMMESEHLDIHKDLDDYIAAKTNIVRHQMMGDVTIHHPTNELTARVVAQSGGTFIPYLEPPGAHIVDNAFIIDEQKICSTQQMKLVGKHNIENACAAITAAWQYTKDTQAIAKALQEFAGLEHRLKFIRELNSVKYYDDSIATTPGSAIAALRTFDQPKVIILGGSDKGADFTELGKEITKTDVRKAILIGNMRERIREALGKAGFHKYELHDEQTTMQQIVSAAHNAAQPGDVVVMSPACASFDMFKNYKDRGQQFIQVVNDLN